MTNIRQLKISITHDTKLHQEIIFATGKRFLFNKDDFIATQWFKAEAIKETSVQQWLTTDRKNLQQRSPPWMQNMIGGGSNLISFCLRIEISV